jgi:hypothetical protein
MQSSFCLLARYAISEKTDKDHRQPQQQRDQADGPIAAITMDQEHPREAKANGNENDSAISPASPLIARFLRSARLIFPLEDIQDSHRILPRLLSERFE